MPDPETKCEACEHRFGNHYFTYGGVGGCNIRAPGVTCDIRGYTVTCKCRGFSIHWLPKEDELPMPVDHSLTSALSKATAADYYNK